MVTTEPGCRRGRHGVAGGIGCAAGAALLSLTMLVGGCGPHGGTQDSSVSAREDLAPDVPRDADAIALNNRGVALMGYFDYAQARDVFAALVDAQPDWLDARVNLAIATLNRQNDGDEARADAILADVLALDSEHLRARFVAGLLALYQGRQEDALAHFRFVADQDPADAYPAYYVGQLLLGQGEADDALRWFDRAMRSDPYLRSAYYGASIALRQQGDMDGALARQQEYLRLEANPRARLAEFKYTRMGPKANALAAGAGAAAPVPAPTGRPAGPLFAPAVTVSGVVPAPDATLTTADIDHDGVQDLFVSQARVVAPRAGATVSARSVVLRGRESGFDVLSRPDDHPLAGLEGVEAAAWADFDNDGLVDVYLCRRGGDQLWRQGEGGGWINLTPALGDPPPPGACRDLAVFDADHDGDVDVFLVGDDADRLFNNNLDGTFTEILAERGMAGPGGGRQIIVTDLDGDRDADIIVRRAAAPHSVYLNDRMWQYQAAAAADEFRSLPAAAMVAADVDADGHGEIYALVPTVDGTPSLHAYQWNGHDFAVVGRWPLPHPASDMTIADVDGDGRLDMVTFGRDDITVLGFTAATVAASGDGLPQAPETLVQRWTDQVCEPGACTSRRLSALLVSSAHRPTAGPALVAASASGLSSYAAGTGRHPYLTLSLSGRESRADSMRSNAAGIGTRVALRRGVHWSIADTFDGHSGAGQSLQPLSFGLAGDAAADFVAVDWSDGVFQTELDLAVGQAHRIGETQRQLASCPVLFAWDGDRHRFVTDLLGVGGIGFFLGANKYSEPRPWERLLLPRGMLAARDGAYVLKLTEPMEEVAYVDTLTLDEISLPPGWDVVLDERHSTDPARPPSGELFYFQRTRVPSRATTLTGADVTSAVVRRDGVAAPVGSRDTRFLGRVRESAGVVLDFGAPLSDAPGRAVLVADGWVEYPYSQTIFAAGQAGAAYVPPSLESSADGEHWQMLAPRFGYPAGMPREMALPLDGLPAGTRYLRVSSTLEIYWDRFRVIYAQPAPEAVRVRRLPLVAARLAQKGFPLRTTGIQRRPGFDYDQRVPFWDTRYLRGAYTMFGDVLELAQAQDDALVLVGAGEELEVRFAAAAASDHHAAGSAPQRRFVLGAYGWAKDMDMYTRGGDTVGPLPSRSADPRVLARRDALHARYHLRPLSGK
jgi:Tfp pilus assembly protein PilF